MDTHTTTLHGLGIEFVHKALTIFNPKWTKSDHSNKLIAFYECFRLPKMPIGEFLSKFKRWTSQLTYNSIYLPPLQISRQFINGLDAKFTTIRNTIPRPTGWESHDIDTLTVTVCN